jgi:hypothetical protein
MDRVTTTYIDVLATQGGMKKWNQKWKTWKESHKKMNLERGKR